MQINNDKQQHIPMWDLFYLNCVQIVVNNVTNKVKLISECVPFILPCSETCSTDDILNTDLQINRYDILRFNSQGRHTGVFFSLLFMKYKTNI